MLLLVAGLVVIVLVILVAVFLSVRSMRADEGSARPARSAGRDRAGRGGMRRGEAGRQPARRRPAEDAWSADHEPAFSDPEHDQSRGALPRPRGHQHDEDPGRRSRPEKRAAARRRQRQESAPLVTGSGRDRSGADWSADDWAGVSDEQYWAELSADKPLATTARSAPAGGGDAYPDTATRDGEADADPADTGGRRAPAPTMAAAGAPAAQFSLHSGSARPGWAPAGPANPPVPPEPRAFADPVGVGEPAASPEAWADPMSTGSVDTDPSIGVRGWQDDGWRDAAGDAAAWQAPVRDEPTARGSRAWAEDPLTSPSFSEPRSYPADSRSYRGSHTRGGGRLDEPGGGSDSSSFGHGHDYQAAPAWDDPYGRSQEDGWRDSGPQYPGGRLDPQPEPAAPAAGPDDGWYSASTSPGGAPSYRQPPHESWERPEPGYDDPYTEPGLRSWPDHHESARYEPPGYDADHGRDSASSGYYADTGYDPAGYGPAGHGYGQPDHGHAGHGYGQPSYGAGEAGYQPSKHGLPDTGYDLPDYDQGPGYGRYPGYDAGRR